MKNNILITSAGRRVSLVKSFQNEASKYENVHKIFTSDSVPEYSAACQISDGSFKIAGVNEASFINELIEICSTNFIGLIIPTIDTELIILAKNKIMFEEKGVKIVISNLDFVQVCRDKNKMNSFFTKKGINVPFSIDVTKSKIQFPIYSKPNNGSLSKDNFIIKNHLTLEYVKANFDNMVYMQYLSPNNYQEYTVDMYYDLTHHLKCMVPRKRLEVRGGEISKGLTVKDNVILIELESKLGFIEGAVGCLTLQLFKNITTNDIFGIEINARFGGGYPLSYFAGANFPKMIIEEFIYKNKIGRFDKWRENLLMLRYDNEIIKEM